MLPTCRQHVPDMCICRQILADIACRCNTEEAPTYPIYINYYRQVQISPNIQVPSYHRVFVFELKQQSRNYRHVGNPSTCRQMSCRFGHPADTTFSCVCNMTETCRRHVANTTQNVAVWATKGHADIRHMELSHGRRGDVLGQGHTITTAIANWRWWYHIFFVTFFNGMIIDIKQL